MNASKINGLFLLLIAGLWWSACSSQEQQATADASKTAATQSQPSPKKESAPAASGCCFTQESDFAPYIPAGDDMLTKTGKKAFSSNFFCGPDYDDKRSSATATYQIDKAGTKDPMNAISLTLQIVDKCADPEHLHAEAERRITNAKQQASENSNLTVVEFQAGEVRGYRYTDITKGNASQNVLLWASVGDRFIVKIFGVNHVRMDMVDRLYAMIPIAQLAEER